MFSLVLVHTLITDVECNNKTGKYETQIVFYWFFVGKMRENCSNMQSVLEAYNGRYEWTSLQYQIVT